MHLIIDVIRYFNILKHNILENSSSYFEKNLKSNFHYHKNPYIRDEMIARIFYVATDDGQIHSETFLAI